MRQWGTIMASESKRAVTTASHFTCKFVEISVDTETGHISIDRVVAGSDVGQVINPVLVEGQIHGGAAQAFGYALLEELQVDRETGRTLNPDYLNYKIFTSRDACRDFEVFFAATLRGDRALRSEGHRGISQQRRRECGNERGRERDWRPHHRSAHHPGACTAGTRKDLRCPSRPVVTLALGSSSRLGPPQVVLMAP